jgi:hypothetical protein
MRLDNEFGLITERGWIIIALCVVLALGILAWGVITAILKLWMYLVTL